MLERSRLTAILHADVVDSTGLVRRRGDRRVRITAELVDSRGGGQIWAERYDRDLVDVFDMQDELTRAVVAVVPQRLEHAELDRVQRRVPANLTAYDCVLRAKLHHHRCTPEDNAQALRLLGQAVALDPHYAAAYGWTGCVLGQSPSTRTTSSAIASCARST